MNNQNTQTEPFEYSVNCTKRSNTGKCAWLISLRSRQPIKSRCKGRLGPKVYFIYPAIYLLIDWTYWNKDVLPHKISIYLAKITREAPYTTPVSGRISIAFDKLENVIQKMPEPLQRIAKAVYDHTPYYHSCVESLEISQSDVEWLVERLRNLVQDEKYYEVEE